MSDGFNLADAFSGGAPPSNTQNANQPQNPNWSNNPWGAYPGAPGAGQQYPGFPAQGQQFPGAPGGGQQFPGAPGGGQQFPGAPGGGQQFPGYPGAGQPTPGAPGAGQTFPSFPGAGQQFPGFGPTPTGPTGPTAPPQSGAQTGPQQLSIPFNLPLHKGIMPRLLITINGAVKNNPKRFTFDFKRNNDIALHFNVRFDENPKVIVRNSMIRDTWGSEERQCPKFPFEAQKPFQIQFLVENDCYKVAVNGETLLQFNHRVRELQEINTFSAFGDITLTSVTPAMM